MATTNNTSLKDIIFNFYETKHESARELIEAIEAAGYTYHHTARGKGYVPSHRYFVESYKGRFGEGYIVKFPNNESAKKSNNYFDIRYYIKAQN